MLYSQTLLLSKMNIFFSRSRTQGLWRQDQVELDLQGAEGSPQLQAFVPQQAGPVGRHGLLRSFPHDEGNRTVDFQVEQWVVVYFLCFII